eukprot:SAG31_NODE_30077_length_385_cov_2.017483_1_plen_58_part_01
MVPDGPGWSRMVPCICAGRYLGISVLHGAIHLPVVCMGDVWKGPVIAFVFAKFSFPKT